MKPISLISAVLGVVLVLAGLILFYVNRYPTCLTPCVIGASLLYLAYKPGRVGLIVFGHACIVVGCVLITLGIYLLPVSQPTLANVFGRPLFWGLFCTFGGICANYHGFCRCVSGGKFDK
ncbi:MAG: hypothetical protein ABSH16_06200 [Sedimentisphaerales bacterium]